MRSCSAAEGERPSAESGRIGGILTSAIRTVDVERRCNSAGHGHVGAPRPKEPGNKWRAVARHERVKVVCCDYRAAFAACFDVVAFDLAPAAPRSVARSPVVPTSSTVSACAFCITLA